MRFKTFCLGASLIVLTACGQGEYSKATSDMQSEVAAMESAVDMAPAPVMAPDGFVEQGGGAAPVGTPQLIAYIHSVGLNLPVKSIEPTLNDHLARCKAAGPSTCIVINSSYNTYSDDQAQASLQLKAKPDWIDTFLGGLEAQAAAAKGEIASRNTSAEDLTVQIIDTDARLNAQLTLQGRLEKLLAERPGELKDVLETERELARVNGEIDSLKSVLAALRQRVSLSELNLGYQTKVNPVSSGALNPLADAFGSFFYNLSAALAAVITVFAYGLPWLLLGGVFLWIWLKLLWPRIRRKKV